MAIHIKAGLEFVFLSPVAEHEREVMPLAIAQRGAADEESAAGFHTEGADRAFGGALVPAQLHPRRAVATRPGEHGAGLGELRIRRQAHPEGEGARAAAIPAEGRQWEATVDASVEQRGWPESPWRGLQRTIPDARLRGAVADQASLPLRRAGVCRGRARLAIETPARTAERFSGALQFHHAGEFSELLLAIAHLGSGPCAGEALGLGFAKNHPLAFACQAARFHGALGDEDLGGASTAFIGYHAELGAEIDDLHVSIRDAETNCLLGNLGLERAAPQHRRPLGGDLQGRGAFQSDDGAGIECDFDNSGFELQLLASVQFLAAGDGGAGPLAIFQARDSRDQFRPVRCRWRASARWPRGE